jgi:hypothetical protein
MPDIRCGFISGNYSNFFDDELFSRNDILFIDSNKLREWYGFAIGSAFFWWSLGGVLSTFGNGVWCRWSNGIILGLQQRLFSKFRIGTNEWRPMHRVAIVPPIVKWNRQAFTHRLKTFTHPLELQCTHNLVCPRGVLKLENGSQEGRE